MSRTEHPATETDYMRWGIFLHLENYRPFPSELKGLLLDPITRGLKGKRATGITWRADPFHLSQHSSSDEVEAHREGRDGEVRVPNMCPGNPK